MIDDRDARHALRTVAMCSQHRWWAEGCALDLAEYEDAALDALVACLARYDATRGVPFSVYAAYSIRGAVKQAWLRYRTWHEVRGQGRWFHAPPRAEVLRPASPDMAARVELAERVQRLPVEAQGYAAMVLRGETDAAYARAAGLTSARWVQQRVQRWRRDAVQAEHRVP